MTGQAADGRMTRISTFGSLGSNLGTILVSNYPKVWSDDDFSVQATTISQLGSRAESNLVACALSLLEAKHIVQIQPNDTSIARMFDMAVAPLPSVGAHSLSCACNRWRAGAKPDKDFVALKRHSAAVSKTNVYFREVIAGLLVHRRS
jgi:hypothetical protein